MGSNPTGGAKLGDIMNKFIELTEAHNNTKTLISINHIERICGDRIIEEPGICDIAMNSGSYTRVNETYEEIKGMLFNV